MMMMVLGFAAGQTAMEESSKTDEGQIEGSVSNQPKRRLTMFRTKREPAPPAKTGLL